MHFLSLLKELFHRDEEKKERIVPYILGSLLFHLFVFLLLPFLMYTHSAPEEKVVELLPLKEDGELYRLADISPPDIESRPENAQLLGQYDSSVEQEQVSTGQKKETDSGEERDETSQKNERAQPKNEKPQLFQVNPKLFARNERASAPQAEFYPDFRVGAKTYLNVLRYPDVDYFVRLKRVFKTTWNPEPALRQDFLNNQVARGSVEVVLGVSVDQKGELAELFVLRSSGMPAYDQEALRTIRASSPFSLPPQKFL